MLKRIENEASAEDITIETFSKAFDKIAHITLNSSLTPG
jgi:RNA polymerase sigma-70 factor (ECF subfamily)